MKTTLLAALLAATALTAGAFDVSVENASSQYKPYPSDGIPPQTPAPEGYEPFHMEHYGRHGSRWLITRDNYDIPVRELAKAEKAGVLTPEGKWLLGVLRRVRDDSEGRLGELTPLGAEQHRGIARRMAANYPALFAPGTRLDAKSTDVIRCILSMANEIQEFTALEPRLDVTTDASRSAMYYMNQHDPEKNAAVDSARNEFLGRFAEARENKGHYLRRLISDEAFIADSLDRSALFRELFEVALNMPSHNGRYPSIIGIFTPEEIQRGWEVNNANWMLAGVYSALTRRMVPRGQRNLLRNMVESADTAVVSPRRSVNLRFGHETMILSLSALMDLDDHGREHNNLETLAEEFRAYEIFPMGCNIQMVFYRRPGDSAAADDDDVLVKILLNEREVPLRYAEPVAQGSPYYRWSDVRRHLAAKAEM